MPVANSALWANSKHMQRGVLWGLNPLPIPQIIQRCPSQQHLTLWSTGHFILLLMPKLSWYKHLNKFSTVRYEQEIVSAKHGLLKCLLQCRYTFLNLGPCPWETLGTSLTNNNASFSICWYWTFFNPLLLQFVQFMALHCLTTIF